MYFADFLYKQSQSSNEYELALAAKNLFPQNPHFLLQAARLAAINNQQAQAAVFIRLALATSPSEINFYKLSSQIYTSMAVKKATYLQDALKTLQKAKTLAPTDPVLPYQIANILSAIKNNKEAIIYYEKAIQLKPNYDNAMMRLAEVYIEQKNYSKTKELLDSAIKINPQNKDKITIPQN